MELFVVVVVFLIQSEEKPEYVWCFVLFFNLYKQHATVIF